MISKVGLWIDHRVAFLVAVTPKGEKVKKITSKLDRRVLAATDTSEDGLPRDGRDQQFNNHLNDYYDMVVGYLRHATAIQIFGPGEAKIELQARLEFDGLKDRIVSLETTDKMTKNQVVAKVRQHFLP